MITIVTSRTYLLCDSINSITLQYNPDRLYNNKVIPFYDIHVDFNRTNANSNNSNSRNSDEGHVLTIRVAGEKVALKVYKEIVQQIREQLPDQVYLDKMLDDILSGGKDIHDEPDEKKVRGVGEKKRGSKAVLRGVSGGRKRRRR